MSSGQPGPRGGLSPTNTPAHFPATFSSLHSKSLKQEKLRDSGVAASGTEYTEVRDVSMLEGFTVYVIGSGDWNVQVSPDQGIGPWVDIQATDITGAGYISSTNPHGWMRVAVKNAANVEVWIHKKYATF